MRWLELSTRAPPEFAEPLTHLFARYGEGGVVVEEAGGYNPDEGEQPSPDAPVTVRTYLPVDATTDDRKAQIDLGVRLISHLCSLSPLQERILEQSEWEHQEFEAIRVGRRLVVAPAGARWDRRPGDAVVTLDPGLAFGTGHHPTTRMCMVYLEDVVTSGCRILDVGCGSGILTLAALRLGAGAAVAVDIEDDAVKSTRDNLRRNALLARATVVPGTLPTPAAPPGAFDVTVANISANALTALAEPLVASLRPGGVFVGSGVLEERRGEVEAALAGAGAVITDVARAGDWVAFKANRASG